MDSRGKLRAVGVSLAALLLVLIGASAVNAATGCSVTVSPKSGAAGSVFTFHGTGFEPTELTLDTESADARKHDLSDMGDPWTLAVRSRPGDEGKWNAEFVSKECTAVAGFSVTLSNTDVADVNAATDEGSLSIPLAMMVLGLGGGSGILLGRRLRALPAHNR